MSLLWRDEIRIWLAPGELRVRRMGRGIRPACVADSTQLIDSTSDWRPALAALDTCLGARTWSGAGARLVLSNRMVRYAIVPWSDALQREAEQLAHARICLADNYGNTGPDWQVCVSDAEPGDTRVACAIPTDLMAGVRAVLASYRVPMLSVQPALIDAYNRCRHLLPQSARWFVSLEPSALTVVRLAARGWEGVYSGRIGADWPTELARIRIHAKLAAQSAADACVFVDAPERLRQAAAIDDPGIEWLTAGEEAAGTSADIEQRQSVRLQT